MKVILAKDIPNIGQKGEVKDVASGYARNYLIPNGLAFEATAGRLKDLKMRQETLAQKSAKEVKEARQLAEKLSGRSFTIQAKAGEEGRLFGSVTSADIVKALAAEGIKVDKRKVEIEENIKLLGTYKVLIKLHPAVVASIDVIVEELKQ